MAGNVALPFFGAPVLPWQRPAGSAFPTWNLQTPAGDASATLTDNPGGLPLVLVGKQDSATYNVSAVLKTKGAPPWTITVGAAAFAPIKVGLAITYPLVLWNSVTDKALTANWYIGDAADTGNFTIGKIPNFSVGGAASIVEDNLGFGMASPDYFTWFRATNDGTNVTFSVSPEGQLWFPTYVEPLASFVGTIDHVGFGVERLNQTSAGHVDCACIVWSWVES